MRVNVSIGSGFASASLAAGNGKWMVAVAAMTMFGNWQKLSDCWLDFWEPVGCVKVNL
jgi:hypothetical protein